MQKNIFKKELVLAVIFLFVAVSFQPIIAENTQSVGKESDYSNVDFDEAKEYLFQTLIDISNNPDVKQFLNEHKHDLITRNNNSYNCKNVIQKIYSQNPRLLKSIIFTKSKMTYEYLKTNYNKGIEIYNILGEEESSKIVESVKIYPEFFVELKNIILNNKDLSDRITTIREINNELKSYSIFRPIFCFINFLLILHFAIRIIIFLNLYEITSFTIFNKITYFYYNMFVVPFALYLQFCD